MANAQSNAEIDSEDAELAAEEKLENEIATEVATQFQRVLDGIRTYPAGHVTLKGYYAGLLEKLQARVNGDETDYSLKVTPMGFATATRIVNRAEKLSDSMTHPLYLDGVQLFTVEQGVNMPELMQLMEIWRATLDGRLGDTHTFSTRVWEADFQYFSVISVETFSEGGTVGDPNRAKNSVQAVVDELAGIAPPSLAAPVAGSAGLGRGRKLVRVTKEDLSQLKAQGITEISEDDLRRHEASQRAPIPGLSPNDAAAVTAEMKTRHAQQIERSLDAVFAVGLDATAEEVDRLRAAFTLVMSAMLSANQIDRLKANLLRQVQMARTGDPATLNARMAVLTRLMVAIGSARILEPTIMALDDEAKREAAMTILRFLPGRTASTLLDWLVVPQTPAGIRTLADLIATLKVDIADLVTRMGWADEEIALELLHLSKALGPAAWPVRKAGLAHPSRKVQHASVTGLDKDTMATHRLELLPLLASPIPEIRHELFNPFVASHDKGTAPALCTLLRRVQVDAAEHKRVLVALGTLGGPEACGALRNELTNNKDEAMQCFAAKSLGALGDEKARPLLEGFANKLFGGGELKAAAKDAIKRLDYIKSKAKRPV